MASNSLFRVDHPSSFICQLLILIAILLFVRVSGVNGAQSKAWPLSYEFGDSEQKCEGLKLSWRKQKSLKNTMARCKRTFKRNWDVLTVCDWDGVNTVNLSCYLRRDEKNPLRTDRCNECIDGLIEKIWDCHYTQEARVWNGECKVEYQSSSDGDPSHPTESSRSTASIGSTVPIKTTESIDFLETTESSKPIEQTEPTDSPNSTEFSKSTEPTKPTESTELTDSPKPTGSTELPSEEDESSSQPKVVVLVLFILLALLVGALCTAVTVCVFRFKKLRKKSVKESEQNGEIQLGQIERSEQRNGVQLDITRNEPATVRNEQRGKVHLAIALNGPQSDESSRQVQNGGINLEQIEKNEQRNEVQLDITPNEPATVRNEQRDEVHLAIILNESQTEELAKQNEEIELKQIKRSEEKNKVRLDLTSKGQQAAKNKRRPARLTLTLNTEPASAPANDFDLNLNDFKKDVILDRNWLEIGERIGSGNFGCVYKGTLKKPEKICLVAVKKLENKQQFVDQTKSELLEEAKTMQKLNHENILEMLGVCFDGRVPMLVLPFMKNGDLLTYLRSENNSPTVLDLLSFALGIGRGMAYLSSKKFVHRDLAARNCMLDENLSIKVGDFGLTRDVHERNYYRQKTDWGMPIRWMSIEAMNFEKVTSKTDIWSYGVVLWELMTRGQTPYSDLELIEVFEFVKGGHRLAKPEVCPNEIYEIMLDCWRAESNRRPSFDQIIQRIEIVTTGKEQFNTSVSREVTYVNYPVKEYYAREGDREREEERMKQLIYAALNRTI